MGGKFWQQAQNCQKGYQSRPPANVLHITSCAACLLHYHGEQAHNHWWTASINISVSCNDSCNHSWRFKDKEGSSKLSYKGSHALTKGEKLYRIARSCLLLPTRIQRDFLPDCLLVPSLGFTIKLWRWQGNICSGNMAVCVQEISDSTFCWKADGLSILGCGGHPVNRVASARANNQQWGILQHPYVYLS